MHHEKLDLWRHQHIFNEEKKSIENRTLIVVAITFLTMITEVVFGWLSNSMALFADGWHMGTHAFALGLSLLAYVYARKYSHDNRFTFGTWKIEILGAYTSAIVLGVIALIMILTSLERILNPLDIQYDHALIVAGIGLLINLICAFILNSQGLAHDHSHEQEQHHEAHVHSHNHHTQEDLNLKSAYLHVVADAFTSILAIIALLGAKYFLFNWLDPMMGIVGAALIIRWSVGLLRETSGILLERNYHEDTHLVEAIKARIESDGDTKISDLHLWKVAQNKYACIISLVTGNVCAVDVYKDRLKLIQELAHVTIEMNLCQ